MKALEKDRTRRYETANGLANDVQRHLRDEPVLAVAPSRAYLVSRWMRRNRGLVTAAGLVATSLVFGMSAAGIGWMRAIQGRQSAVRSAEQAALAKDDAERQRDIAHENQERAEEASKRSEAMLVLLTDMLKTARPGSTRGSDYTVRELIDEVSGEIEIRLANDIAAQAELHAVVGKTYEQLDLLDRGIIHLRTATEISRSVHGEKHLTTLQHQLDLNWAILKQDNDREQLEASTKQLISDISNRDPVPVLTFDAQFLLAVLYQRIGREQESGALCRQILDDIGDIPTDDKARLIAGKCEYHLGFLITQRFINVPVSVAVEHANKALMRFNHILDESTSRLLLHKAKTHLVAGIALTDLGEQDAADPHAEFAARNIIQSGSDSFVVWLAQELYVSNLIDQNRAEDASTYVDDLTKNHSSGTPEMQSIVRRTQALVAEYVGDLERSERLRKLEMDESLRSGDLLKTLEAATELARFLNLQNRNPEADAIYSLILPMGKQFISDIVRKSERPHAYLSVRFAWCLAYYGGSSNADLEEAARLAQIAAEDWRGNNLEAWAQLVSGVANVRLGRLEASEKALHACLAMKRPSLRMIHREAERVLGNLLNRNSDRTSVK